MKIKLIIVSLSKCSEKLHIEELYIDIDFYL